MTQYQFVRRDIIQNATAWGPGELLTCRLVDRPCRLLRLLGFRGRSRIVKFLRARGGVWYELPSFHRPPLGVPAILTKLALWHEYRQPGR